MTCGIDLYVVSIITETKRPNSRHTDTGRLTTKSKFLTKGNKKGMEQKKQCQNWGQSRSHRKGIHEHIRTEEKMQDAEYVSFNKSSIIYGAQCAVFKWSFLSNQQSKPQDSLFTAITDGEKAQTPTFNSTMQAFYINETYLDQTEWGKKGLWENLSQPSQSPLLPVAQTHETEGHNICKKKYPFIGERK